MPIQAWLGFAYGGTLAVIAVTDFMRALSFTPQGYDIIGDVHGCALTLAKLLERLGYAKQGNHYRHPNRLAVFLGDIVDRGPHIREALHMVKNMTDAGVALCIMGNHEYNAIGYTTRAGGEDTPYLRRHTPRHNRLIAETLEQFASFPEEWRMFLKWFRTLPLFLELPGFRAVHACWDDALIKEFKKRYGTNTVTEEFIIESRDKSTFAGRFMDRLTRGTDLELPEGVTLTSKDGYERSVFRTKFWAHNPECYRDVVFQPDPLPDEVANMPLSDSEKNSLLHYPEQATPVFVGHYWLQGKPRPIQRNLACLDYSAVKYGRLVAYRFDGEEQLSAEKFVWVYVDPE